jgi:hypothetical protein
MYPPHDISKILHFNWPYIPIRFYFPLSSTNAPFDILFNSPPPFNTLIYLLAISYSLEVNIIQNNRNKSKKIQNQRKIKHKKRRKDKF